MIDQPELGAARAPLRPDRGWTWQEESAMALAGGEYEIRIRGHLSDALLAAFKGRADRPAISGRNDTCHAPTRRFTRLG